MEMAPSLDDEVTEDDGRLDEVYEVATVAADVASFNAKGAPQLGQLLADGSTSREHVRH